MDDRSATDNGATAKRAILAGDPEGLRAFLNAHLRPLYGYCYRRVGGDPDAAEEVVQETMMEALERVEEFDPERGDMHEWLSALSRNAIRRLKLARERAVGLDEEELLAPEAGRNGRAAAEAGIALARLPERYRAVLEQKYVLGKSVREIAADRGEVDSEKAIESLLVRARNAFRRAFKLVSSVEVER